MQFLFFRRGEGGGGVVNKVHYGLCENGELPKFRNITRRNAQQGTPNWRLLQSQHAFYQSTLWKECGSVFLETVSGEEWILTNQRTAAQKTSIFAIILQNDCNSTVFVAVQTLLMVTVPVAVPPMFENMTSAIRIQVGFRFNT